MMTMMTMETIIIAGGSLAMECPAAASALIVFPHPQCNALALGSESEQSVHIALYTVQSVPGLFKHCTVEIYTAVNQPMCREHCIDVIRFLQSTAFH